LSSSSGAKRADQRGVNRQIVGDAKNPSSSEGELLPIGKSAGVARSPFVRRAYSHSDAPSEERGGGVAAAAAVNPRESLERAPQRSPEGERERAIDST